MNLIINLNNYSIINISNMSTKDNQKHSVKDKKKYENKNYKKKHTSSDDDDDEYYSSNSEEEMDIHEYRKLLSSLFPSKHINSKVNAGKQLKSVLSKAIKKEADNDDDEDWET